MTGELEAGVRRVLKNVLLEVAREILPEIRSVASYRTMTQADAPTLLRPRDVAAALCISERHLHALTKEGTIPCIRLNRLVRYSTDGLRAWITETEGKYCGEGYHLPMPTTRELAPEGKTAQKRKLPQRPKKQAEKTARKPAKVHRQQSPIVHDEPNDFDRLLGRVGVSPENLPPITYPELAKAGGITANQLHSFLCSHADLPESAVTRYREYFSAQHAEREQAEKMKQMAMLTEPRSDQAAKNDASPVSKWPRSLRDIAEAIGLDAGNLPRLTNGDLMRMAGVDRVTLHAWQHLGGELPALAISRLEDYLRTEIKRS